MGTTRCPIVPPSPAPGRWWPLSLTACSSSHFSPFFSIYLTLTFSFDPFVFYRLFVSVLTLCFCLCCVLQFQITGNISCISLFSSLSHKSRGKKKMKKELMFQPERSLRHVVSRSVAPYQLEWTLDTILLMRELLMQVKSICL